jgi:hypothetical protein
VLARAVCHCPGMKETKIQTTVPYDRQCESFLLD